MPSSRSGESIVCDRSAAATSIAKVLKHVRYIDITTMYVHVSQTDKFRFYPLHVTWHASNYDHVYTSVIICIR